MMPDARPLFYRVTNRARVPQQRDCAVARSRYLRDVFEMCERGIWERELRQFMPPASLKESVDSLLALGLIECAESPNA
jgi:hypothetical protein